MNNVQSQYVDFGLDNPPFGKTSAANIYANSEQTRVWMPLYFRAVSWTYHCRECESLLIIYLIMMLQSMWRGQDFYLLTCVLRHERQMDVDGEEREEEEEYQNGKSLFLYSVARVLHSYKRPKISIS